MGISNPRPGSIWSSPLMQKNVTDYNNSMGGLVKWAPRLATAAVGGLAGAAAMPALFGGGTAATVAGVPSVAGSTVPAAASGMTIGKILSNPLTSLGVNTITSLLGARSANKANKYAVDRNAEGLARQIAMEEQRIAADAEERRLQRIEDQRRWEAEEAYKAKVLAASEDDRLLNRSILEKRQARIDAYDPLRQRAMRSVGAILGF